VAQGIGVTFSGADAEFCKQMVENDFAIAKMVAASRKRKSNSE
jgi:hypothetical protein